MPSVVEQKRRLGLELLLVVLGNVVAVAGAFAGVRVFTEYLRQAGYHTSNLKGGELEGTGKTDFNFTAPKPFSPWLRG